MRVSLALRVVVACTLLGVAQSSFAQQQPQPPRAQHPPRPNYERIIDFHSEVTLNQDASLQVTETIAVLAQGNQIRHGIYREFPTRYTDAFNNKYVVGFQMLCATRDSVEEPFRVEDYANGKRIYLGSAATMVSRGPRVAAIPFLFGELLGLFLLLKLTSLALVLFVVASGALHLLFVYLLKAPTFAGRRLMDQVEGFKMFLRAVDGDRLNHAAPPQQTSAVFEKFLPYALALDVEQDWAEKFSGILAVAGTAPNNAGQVYTPTFYSGSSWNGFSGTGFASSFSSSLTSAISSSSAAPGSCGGGGGGSGGGGGGGGGW